MVADLERLKGNNARNITQSGSVSVLGIESHVFKSHYFDRYFFFGKMTERLIVIDCKSIRF